jgi:hypothetical protein
MGKTWNDDEATLAKSRRGSFGEIKPLVAVIASISVGLFAVGLITSLNVILTEDMRTVSGYDSGHLHIPFLCFDDRLVDKIRELPYVGDAEGRRA